MASFGHVAAGLLSGRLHGGGNSWDGDGPAADGGGRRRRPSSWKTFLLFVALALLPDADLLLVTLGACDSGACGHRGASHSLPLAIAIGFMAALAARRLGWPVLRTAVATTFAVGSHALLDLLGAGGRGLPLLWPFTDMRFFSPIRIFPDAPRGLALLSRPGIVNVTIELAVFLPVMLYAVWPRMSARLAARAVGRAIPKLPSLSFVEGTTGLASTAAAATASAPSAPDESDPPVRSAG
jgi:inner membrane protein